MSGFSDAAEALAWAHRALRGIAFVGPDAHYAVGLDAIVPDLTVAVADDAPSLEGLRAAGAECVVAGEDVPDGSPGRRGERNALAILNDPRVQAVLERRSVERVIVFKSSHALEQAARDQGRQLIAASSAVARRWENKTAFVDLGARLGLDLPPSASVELAHARYAGLAERFGPRLVVQAPHGYAGARTILVEDESSFEAARRVLRSPLARVASFVDGRPMTLNACVTARGTAVGAPFVQRTGEPAFTPYRLGSCGQLWTGPACGGSEAMRRADAAAEPAERTGGAAAEVDSARSGAGLGAAVGTPPRARDAMVEAARRIGDALAADGFAGIFGVDFVVPHSSGAAPLVIEVNPRLVASIAAYTQLELMSGRLPLLVRHIAALVVPDADRAPLDAHLDPLCGAQIVLHNVGEGEAAIPAGLSGRWRCEHGRWHLMAEDRPAIRIAQTDPLHFEAIVLTGAPGRLVAPGSEWARVQRGPLGGLVQEPGGGDPSAERPWGSGVTGWTDEDEQVATLAARIAGRLGR